MGFYVCSEVPLFCEFPPTFFEWAKVGFFPCMSIVMDFQGTCPCEICTTYFTCEGFYIVVSFKMVFKMTMSLERSPTPLKITNIGLFASMNSDMGLQVSLFIKFLAAIVKRAFKRSLTILKILFLLYMGSFVYFQPAHPRILFITSWERANKRFFTCMVSQVRFEVAQGDE
jgi:hypothetical protein